MVEQRGALVPTSYVIDDVELSDCPRAIVTPESDRLVQLFGAGSVVAGESGAAIYGARLTEWPARMFDAALVVSSCESERSETAESRMRSNQE
jgi:hypothetical protein